MALIPIPPREKLSIKAHQVLAGLAAIGTRLGRVVLQNKVFSITFVVLLALRYLIAPFGHIVVHTDTSAYCDRAQAPWWNLFWGTIQGKPFWRPWGYPLLLKLCHFRPDYTPASGGMLLQAQILISVLALGAAGLAGCRIFSKLILRIAWMGCFFAFSLTAFIYPWEPVAMTEGVACNGVNFLLVMMFVLASPEWGLAEVILTAFFTTCVMFLKDANSFYGLIILGLVGLDQILVRHRPLAAFTRLKAGLVQSPRQLFRAPLFILACLLLLATGLKYRDIQQHKAVRDANITMFLLHRIFKSPPLYKAYIESFPPPRELQVPPKPSEDDSPFWRYVETTYKHQHLRFLLANPGLMFSTFNQYSGDIIAWAALPTMERLPKPYVYLYSWGKNNRDPNKPDPKMVFSFRVHQWVVRPFSKLVESFGPWPVFVPLSLLLATFFLKLKIGRAGLFLPFAFLTCTFYLQHGLSIFFEGIEDYRHALTGTYALILMPWLFAMGGLQWLLLRGLGLWRWTLSCLAAAPPELAIGADPGPQEPGRSRRKRGKAAAASEGRNRRP